MVFHSSNSSPLRPPINDHQKSDTRPLGPGSIFGNCAPNNFRYMPIIPDTNPRKIGTGPRGLVSSLPDISSFTSLFSFLKSLAFMHSFFVTVPCLRIQVMLRQIDSSFWHQCKGEGIRWCQSSSDGCVVDVSNNKSAAWGQDFWSKTNIWGVKLR